MAVAGVNAAPIVNDNVGAKLADDANHIFHHWLAPDFFRFLGCLRKTKVLGSREIEFHAVAARGLEEFLRANQAELRSLFRAESVLAPFAARDGEQRDIRVQAPRKIGECGGAFVIGVRGDIQDARGDASRIDGLDGVGESRAGAGGGRKLRAGSKREERAEEKNCDQAGEIQRASMSIVVARRREAPEGQKYTAQIGRASRRERVKI